MKTVRRRVHSRGLRSGEIHPLLVFAVVFGVIVAGGIVATIVAYPRLKDAVAQRREEKRAAKEIAEQAERLVSGQEPAGPSEFPDTPIGHMQKIVSDHLVNQSKLDKGYEQGLTAIGWDWVLTPESVSTKHNLEDCLGRIQKAQRLSRAYEADNWSALRHTAEALSKYAHHNRETRAIYESYRSALDTSSENHARAVEIFKALHENQAACELACRHLLRHFGKYTVAEDGTVTFMEGVPDQVVAAYNDIIDRLTAAGERLQRFDEARRRAAHELLSKARSAAGN